MNTQEFIGQVKRDISELVNRVTYAGERIILSSRGKPNRHWQSMGDYERLLQPDQFPMPVQDRLRLHDMEGLSSHHWKPPQQSRKQQLFQRPLALHNR